VLSRLGRYLRNRTGGACARLKLLNVSYAALAGSNLSGAVFTGANLARAVQYEYVVVSVIVPVRAVNPGVTAVNG
jgi:hypothetical protein